MLHVGLDVHERTSSYCILDENCQVVKERKIRGNQDLLLVELAQIRGPWWICFEASCGYGVLYEKLAKMAERVVVAHPAKLRLIFRSKRKNDRVDARKLAMLLKLGEVPQVWVPPVELRNWRELVEFRRRLVDKRTRVKNAMQALLRGCGVRKALTEALRPRKGSAGPGLWAKKGVAVLGVLELPTATDRLRRDLLLRELEGYEAELKQVEGRLDEMAAGHPGVALLRTIPGVGVRTAEAVLAYVGDPHRFARNKQVGAYAGLVPCQDASAGANRLGHITKEGPGTLRWLLTEAAWQGIRKSPTVGAFYERVRQGQGDRRKTGLIATAHHLLRVMLAMLKSGEVWRESEAAAVAEPLGAGI
jgi:transposase